MRAVMFKVMHIMARLVVATALLGGVVAIDAKPAAAAPGPSSKVAKIEAATPGFAARRAQAALPAATAAAPGTVPALPAASGAGRRIVYSNSAQRVWLVNADETVHRSYLVSGRRGVPRPGTYSVFSKSRYSSSGSVRMEHMTRFARGSTLAIGFHSIPVDRRGRPIQSTSQLGTFRSHGCVRQAPSDAAYLWDWAPIGTVVVVTP